MEFYGFVEGLTTIVDSRWAWGALAVATVLLAIWNGGRNEASLLIFPISFAAALLNSGVLRISSRA